MLPATPLDPALLLLVRLVLVIAVGLPLIAWLLVQPMRDGAARLWFGGAAANAAAALFAAALQRGSFITSTLLLGSVLLYIVALQQERRAQPPPGRALVVVLLLYALVLGSVDHAGLWLSWGYGLTSLALLTALGFLLWLLFEVGRARRSRGLILIAVGIAAAWLSHLVRLADALVAGTGTPLFAFSVTSNMMIAAFTLGSVFSIIGYVVFMLEKAHRRHLADVEEAARAQERERAALAQARALEDLVRQRNAMIVLNSRFSTVNALATYTSSIVHELSQPLQGLSAVLDTLALRSAEAGAALQTGLGHAQDMVHKMSATLLSLRQLIMSNEPALAPLELGAVLQEVLPIMQAEARRRGVSLVFEADRPGQLLHVEANRVLLQRVLFNLVANALEALEQQAGADRVADRATGHISVGTAAATCHGAEYAVIHVRDNGPGLPAAMLGAESPAFSTSKPQGVGLGLALVRLIVASWRGEVHALNRAPESGGGACIEIWIPLRQPCAIG